MIKVGIVGSTGYAGFQLVNLFLRHKLVEIKFLISSTYSGNQYSDIFPSLKNIIKERCINIHNIYNLIPTVDIIFLAMPHGKSFDITKFAYEKSVIVIDLGADYRLKNHLDYEKWYKLKHQNPDFLRESVYGLPEINKKLIEKAKIIANPGCYPTATILGLLPLIKNKIIDPNFIIIDGKSGITGAGRSISTPTHFPECNESIKAYSLKNHRHTKEIEQEISNINNEDINIQFTPHLLPINRGILISSYLKAIKSISEKTLFELYKDFYKKNYFIRIKDTPPETRFVRKSNFCDISVKYDHRTNNIIVISAIDNLMKGAASQAIQNMNIRFGIDEKTGIDIIPDSL